MDGAEKLLQEKSLQIGLSEPCVTAIKSGGALILDFGEELSGIPSQSLSRLGERRIGVYDGIHFGRSIGGRRSPEIRRFSEVVRLAICERQISYAVRRNFSVCRNASGRHGENGRPLS